jgi:hypothetical protein
MLASASPLFSFRQCHSISNLNGLNTPSAEMMHRPAIHKHHRPLLPHCWLESSYGVIPTQCHAAWHAYPQPPREVTAGHPCSPF